MKVLLADDDREQLDVLQFIFRRAGYGILTASDGQSAWALFQIESPDLLVLDMQMPKSNGLEVLRAVRSQSGVPVMMLTVLNEEETAVRALDFGADDYLTKPYHPGELRARAHALLRRSQRPREGRHTPKKRLVCHDIMLDPDGWQVTVANEPVRLTRTEFSLLHYLMLNANTVVRTGAILENVWGYSANESDEVLRASVSRLRKKIEIDPSHPQYILNSPGVGYMLAYRG